MNRDMLVGSTAISALASPRTVDRLFVRPSGGSAAFGGVGDSKGPLLGVGRESNVEVTRELCSYYKFQH
jgi:hypothetical protein